MPDYHPEPPSTTSIMALILVPLGLILIFGGLCVGLWMIHIAYTALYEPEQIPLISKVLALIEKDDTFIKQVKTDDGVRWEGAAVRYGVLMLLFIVVLSSIGSIIKGFISAGSALLKTALDKPPPPDGKRPPEKR
jgi:hypothetical protein